MSAQLGRFLPACRAHGVAACMVCTINEVRMAGDQLNVSRAEVKRDSREDGVFPFELGGES